MRKQFSKSDIKQFLEEHPKASAFLTKKSNVAQEDNLLVIDGINAYFLHADVWVPTLHLLVKYPDTLPKLTVDKGAIKFVVNGADIMRPGITACEACSKDDYVVIVDENFSKPIAVGQVMLASDELLATTNGKVVKNVHRVGDAIWG